MHGWIALAVAGSAACGRPATPDQRPVPPAAAAAATDAGLPEIDWARHRLADEGCFWIRDLATGDERVNDRDRCAQPRRPHSTFKIPNALIGLDVGILDGPDAIMVYDAKAYPHDESWPAGWDRDQTLREAIKISAVPLFRRLANQIGSGRMQKYVDRLGYGNRDLGGAGLDWFWLGGRLRISAPEQVELLSRLIEGKLPVSQRAQEVVRDILFQDQRGEARFHGKTGTGTIEDPERDGTLAWMVGWVEMPERTLVYAMWIEGATAEEVRARRRATVNAVLADLGAPAPPAP